MGPRGTLPGSRSSSRVGVFSSIGNRPSEQYPIGRLPQPHTGGKSLLLSKQYIPLPQLTPCPNCRNFGPAALLPGHGCHFRSMCLCRRVFQPEPANLLFSVPSVRPCCFLYSNLILTPLLQGQSTPLPKLDPYSFFAANICHLGHP